MYFKNKSTLQEPTIWKYSGMIMIIYYLLTLKWELKQAKS